MTRKAMSQERLRWIETWARGWQRSVGGTSKYEEMALDVATLMVLECVEALRDPNYALDLVADVLHESELEIADAIAMRRSS